MNENGNVVAPLMEANLKVYGRWLETRDLMSEFGCFFDVPTWEW